MDYALMAGMTMLRLACLCCALVLLTGCATMAGSGPERIAVESSPSGADVSVDCGRGIVATGVTPAAVPVPRTDDDCVVTISKQGFVSRDVVLESGLNPRFWLNLPLTFGVPLSLVYIVFKPGDSPPGAVVGMALGAAGAAGMIIDSVSDAKRDHDPKRISVTLAPSPP